MIVNDTTYSDGVSDAIVSTLERVRKSSERIRVFYGDTDTGRDWNEECGVEGYVGRSVGPIKVPILIHNRRSMAGAPILDLHIVKITRTAGKKVLYEHPTYHTGRFTVSPCNLVDGYDTVVKRDGEEHARFENHAQAVRWSKRMQITLEETT